METKCAAIPWRGLARQAGSTCSVMQRRSRGTVLYADIKPKGDGRLKDLITKSCEEIMTTLYKPTVFAVDGLLAQGLYILAGSPKVGKSWLALELCLAVAKGEPLLDRPTQQGTSLYFCLEDRWQRIQSRLYEMTEEPSNSLFFSLNSDTIGSGLEEQIIKFKAEHDDLRLVVIDTLQIVRSETDSSYGSDYAELLPLKTLAEQLGISIVLVHHLRKAADSDPFNMISGSTGLNGCVDGMMVLMKSKRGSGQAMLHCTRRDIEDCELTLSRQGARWVLTDVHEDKPPDTFVFAVHDLMSERNKLSATATELSAELEKRFRMRLPSNMFSKKLMQHGYELRGYGVSFEIKRSHGKRWLELTYDPSGDSSNGRLLYPESCCPADTRSCEKPLDTLSEQGDGSAVGDTTRVCTSKLAPCGDVCPLSDEVV